MVHHPRMRRALSVTWLTLGAVALFLVPDGTWPGLLMVALGLCLEVYGTYMRHRAR